MSEITRTEVEELRADLAHARAAALVLSDRIHRLHQENIMFMAMLCTQCGGQFVLSASSMIRCPPNPAIETVDDPISGARIYRLADNSTAGLPKCGG